MQQESLLASQTSQQVFEQIQDDSSSLAVLYDHESFQTKRTCTTTATSKLSMKIAFDGDLLQHGAYQSTFRSLSRLTSTTNGKQPMRTGSTTEEQRKIDDVQPMQCQRNPAEVSETVRQSLQILVLVRDISVLASTLRTSCDTSLSAFDYALAREQIINWAVSYCNAYFPSQRFRDELAKSHRWIARCLTFGTTVENSRSHPLAHTTIVAAQKRFSHAVERLLNGDSEARNRYSESSYAICSTKTLV